MGVSNENMGAFNKNMGSPMRPPWGLQWDIYGVFNNSSLTMISSQTYWVVNPVEMSDTQRTSNDQTGSLKTEKLTYQCY